MPIEIPQTSEDTRQFVKGVDENGALIFQQVDIAELSFKGRFGATAHSSTENDISIGDKYFVLDVDDGKFRVGDDVQITSLADSDCYMWGSVIGRDTVAEPVRLRIYVDDLSAVTMENCVDWELQVVARPKFGITKDTSATEIDPTEDGPFTLTVTAGKFFPLGGTLQLFPVSDPSIALLATVSAYSGTSLIIEKTETNATVSQSYDAWAISLLDAPPASMPKRQITGMLLTVSGFDVTVSPGTIRDFEDTVNLNLTTPLTKSLESVFSAGTGNGGVVAVALPGTVTTNNTETVTGSGTSFTTYFPDSLPSAFNNQPECFNADYDEQNGVTDHIGPIVHISGKTVSVRDTASDTSIYCSAPLVAQAAHSYTRGGVIPELPSTTEDYVTYFAVLVRSDIDGSIDMCFTSSTHTGEPDLPAGYSKYRTLGILYWTCNSENEWSCDILQPLYNNYPFAYKDHKYIVWDFSTFYHENEKRPASTTSIIATLDQPTIQFKRAALTGDVTASENSNATSIANNAVTNAKAADMAQATIKGRASGAGTGDPTDLTATQVRTILNVADGATAYTDEQAQDAVGTILTDSSEIDFTYNDAAPSITASIVAGSIDETKLDASVNASLDLADSAAQNAFRTISVSGQSDVVADSATDTLTLAAGSNVTITTDASTDTITIAASSGGISMGKAIAAAIVFG